MQISLNLTDGHIDTIYYDSTSTFAGSHIAGIAERRALQLQVSSILHQDLALRIQRQLHRISIQPKYQANSNANIEYNKHGQKSIIIIKSMGWSLRLNLDDYSTLMIAPAPCVRQHK
jgi:hypothetical protein